MEFIDLRCRWTERTRSRGAGWFYYKGVGLQNGLSVELDDPVHTEAAFVAIYIGCSTRCPAPR
jgi:hypothetical protein